MESGQLRKLNLCYAGIQSLYWAGFAAIWAFLSVLLLYRGFSNSQIGTVSALALLMPLAVQPVLASLADRDRRFTSRRLAMALTGLLLLCAVGLWYSAGSMAVTAALYVLVGISLTATAPFHSAMAMELQQHGVALNYGLSRGLGSACYAASVLVLGVVVERYAPTAVLPVFAGEMLLLLLLTWRFRASPTAEAAAEALEREGAVWKDSAAQCAAGCGVVITIVGYPQDVEEVYFGPGGLLESAQPGTVLIDMTTTSPTLAQRIYREGTARGLRVLDAPVTGGDSGARAGTLSILVGGDQADFDACLPIFQAMGTNITYFGPAGCGQHAKMANQIMIAGALSGVCEALTYAKAEGLDGNTLLGAVSTGAAGSKQLDFQGKKILAGDFAPGFFMKHFVKDMRLAEEEAENAGLDLNVLQQALSNCQSLIDRGCGDLGTQALIKFYEK